MTDPVREAALPVAEAEPRRRSARAIAAASAGTFIEWYEYGLYAFVAGLVIAPLFFAQAGSLAVLATFVTFAVGFVVRPIGGIVLGAAGDRWGRRPVLIFSILLMGLATTGIGLLPTYAAIGVWAPILLVVLRMLQGFGAGAELAAAMIFVSESTGKKGKGFSGALMNIGSMLGSVLAVVFFTVLSSELAPEAFKQWGWRIPFLFGAVLTVAGLVLRRKLAESPEFERVAREQRAGRLRRGRANPLAALAQSFRASPRNFFAGFLLPSGLNVTGFVAQAFGMSYLSSQIGLTSTQTLVTTLTMMGVGLFALLFWGWLCDRIGAVRVLYVGALVGIPLAFAYFALLRTGNLALIITASVVLWAVGWAAGLSAQVVLLPALFRTEYRGSGMTSSRELQGGLIAGPAPLIASALLLAAGGTPWLVALYIAAAQVLTVAGMLLARPVLSRREITEISALRGVRPAAD
ncbi:MFS transporter [Amycolatopsis rhabdoformis]|uniref:MFS transporter n=1 Tax=Amycolatopsis rhabdoformis TaxID=1448059 RepID=A0ABZ1IEG8_9PSEU|nr:MFS transporter [Amycolatopsis rhabdoformis]WSE32484.1 MFS transporter [Amycolatopsis rhabdoformis]